MTKRAKFMDAERRRGVVTLWYEYRGRTYCINPGEYTPTAVQHRMAQEDIDIAIEREEKVARREAERPYRYEDTAQAGFDLFWKYVTDEIGEEELKGE